MKTTCGLMITALSVLLAFGAAGADTTRTQTIDLVRGWNSVFLEVAPEDPAPDAVFAGTPVAQAIAYFPKLSPVLFIQDPDETRWEKSGWHRWAPPGNPEAVLNDLYRIQANKTYILFSTADYTWRITGDPRFRKRKWRPDSFNLVGFHVDESAPPTFAQFFGMSRAHVGLKAYRLIDNQWRRILDPSAANIVSGRAYWVYCDGGSNHQGPLKITLPGSGDGLGFTGPLHEREIEILNNSPNPLSFTVETLPGNEVPLSLVQKDLTAETVVSYAPFTAYSPASPLEPGETVRVRLAARRKEIEKDAVSGLLKITDDLGDRFYVPVRAEKF